MEGMPNYKGHLEADESCPSGRSTPIFAWTPLPQRRKLRFTEHKKDESAKKELELYPNCDVNVWLRSCEKEIVEPISGVIKGHIPPWLNGCLIRNGPGSLKAGNDEFSHLFDSSALLHRYGIKDGKVTYQCRFLQSDVYKKNWSANRIVLTEFGTRSVPDPCHTIFQRIAAVFNNEASDNAMISVYPIGDELYAFTETPTIHRINKETLETEGKVNINDYLSIVNHTSHPHVLPDGTVYNLGTTIYAKGPYHTIVEFPKDEKADANTMFKNAKIVAEIPTRWPLNPSYMHTFVEQPLCISVPGMISAKFKNEPLAGCFRWYHEGYTQFNVISRKTGHLVRKFQAEAFFYLHIIHQYEEKDYIIIDICMYKDPSMLDCMYIETMKSMQQNPNYAKMFRGRPARFALPLNPECMEDAVNKNLIELENTKAKAYYLSNGDILVKPERIVDLGCETPRIHYEHYLGQPYRYFYAISSDVDAKNPGTIIKVDTLTRSSKTWCEENCYPSEPIFIPRPNFKCEDDGVILASLVWGRDDINHAGLLILDAQTFTEIGRAEFNTPGPVPKCLHGWFCPKYEQFN
nr:unnamed protein product [Callosobruchus analis]